MPLLPPEIMDMVIDHLFNDKPALSSCALVCQDWLPSTRYHLFHTLRVQEIIPSNQPRYAALHNVWLQDFQDFVRSSPAVCTYIKELHVASYPEDSSMVLHVGVATLLTIFTSIPALEYLSLCTKYIVIQSSYGGLADIASPNPLRKLSIHGPTFENWALDSLLSLFSSIDILQAGGISVLDDSNENEYRPPSMDLQLRSLVLDFSHLMPSSLNLDVLVPTDAHLSFLDIALFPTRFEIVSYVQHVGRFVRTKCSQVQYLRIDMSWANMETFSAGKASTIGHIR